MNTLLKRSSLIFIVWAGCAAQVALKSPLKTPVVNADRSLTFQYFAPAAKKVSVSLDLYKKPIAMTMAADGIWSATTAPLSPEFYGYSMVADGVGSLDPFNGDVRFNYVSFSNQVLVPGTPPEPWELTAVPHGRVDHICYTTRVAKNLPLNQSCYSVYLPPAYDARMSGGYPVLYLLHGWSDNETAWTQVGHAQYILDNLIAAGKAIPMIVVMPQGYGNFDFVSRGFGVWQQPAKVDENVKLFSDMLETEVMPAVESSYNVAKGREHRAIAGLSMGGLEALTIGLNHSDQFAYVAGMSSAIHLEGFDTHFAGFNPRPEAKTPPLKLLWIGCGLGDQLLQPNRDFVAWAKAKGQPVTVDEMEGAHTWLVWRPSLVELAPKLFR